MDYDEYPSFGQQAGAFVTLTKDGDLRGCIGFITSSDPLFQTVMSAARYAAAEDPLFSPVDKSELDKLKLEISILSPPVPISSYDEIEVGKHGLIVKEGYNSGLLLPQVPVEHNMDKDEYLTAICRKAGLPANLWKEKELNLEVFTAQVFSEE
jgi:AmmeMemoRadiSam system protein A